MRQLVKFVLGILILVFSGCTKDFREINTNRNNPTSVTPDLLLSGVIRSTMNQQVSEAWSIGNLVAQYNAKIPPAAQRRPREHRRRSSDRRRKDEAQRERDE